MNKLVHVLIPARGGSKSIKDKNIIDVLGKPLINWSIELAQSCKNIDRVFVSTDSEKIKKIAEECGAEVPYLRPKNISGDRALDIEFIRYHIKWLKDNEIDLPYAIVHLRTTGPGRCIADIEKAIKIIKSDETLTGLRSISLSKLSPYKMWKLSDTSVLSPLVQDGIDEAHSRPRQELPRVFWQNGYVDIIKPSTVSDMNSMVGDNCFGLITSDEIIDLDYISDIPQIEKNLQDIVDGKVSSLLVSDFSNHSV